MWFVIVLSCIYGEREFSLAHKQKSVSRTIKKIQIIQLYSLKINSESLSFDVKIRMKANYHDMFCRLIFSSCTVDLFLACDDPKFYTVNNIKGVADSGPLKFHDHCLLSKKLVAALIVTGEGGAETIADNNSKTMQYISPWGYLIFNIFPPTGVVK